MLPQFTLVEHLTEIRKRLIKTLIAFIAIFIYVYTKTDQLIDFILDMATKIDFIYTKPEELLMSYLKLDFLAALLLTVPIFMFQCWRFVRPALKKNERLKCLIFFLMATILFFAGASFSLFVTTPLCLRFLSEFTNYKIDPMLSIENYLSFIINMTTVCPFGAPTIDESAKKCKKCDFCYDLIKNGKNPACVDVCNARALDFGELDDLKAKYAGAKSVGGETKASTLIIKK